MPNNYDVTIPDINGESIKFVAKAGEITFLLGPNGAGKSTLVYQLSPKHINHVTRVSAGRDISLEGSAAKLSGAQRTKYATWIKNELNNTDTRFHSNQKHNIRDTALYDLKEACTYFDRIKLAEIKATQDGSDDEKKAVEKLKNEDSPLQRIVNSCLLYTSPSPRDKRQSRMPSSA